MKTQSKPYSKNALIAITSIVYFVSYFTRKDFAAAIVAMLNAEVIDKATVGLVEMGMFIAYGVGQLISGYLGDKIKPKYLLLAGLFTTACCNLAMPLLTNATLMIPVWTLNGLAQSMLWPPIVRMLAQYLDRQKYVTASLFVTGSANGATIVLYIYTSICIKYYDWQTVFYTATALAFLAICLFVLSLFFILPKDESAKTPVTAKIEYGSREFSTVHLFNKAGIFYVFGIVCMMGILRDGIESWLPTIYADAFNRTPEEATLLSVLLPVFAVLSLILAKRAYKTKLFSNEIRGAGILFASCALICIPLRIFVSSDVRALQIIMLVLSALVCACMHACNFFIISCLPGRFAPYGKSATTSGYCNSFVYVGAAIASYGFPLFAKFGGWGTTVFAWIAVCLLGVLFAALAIKKYTAFIKDDIEEEKTEEKTEEETASA